LAQAAVWQTFGTLVTHWLFCAMWAKAPRLFPVLCALVAMALAQPEDPNSIPAWNYWDAAKVAEHLRSELVVDVFSRWVAKDFDALAFADETEKHGVDGQALRLVLEDASPCTLLRELVDMRLGDCMKMVKVLQTTMEDPRIGNAGPKMPRRRYKGPWYWPHEGNIRNTIIWILAIITVFAFLGDQYYTRRVRNGKEECKAQDEAKKKAREGKEQAEVSSSFAERGGDLRQRAVKSDGDN